MGFFRRPALRSAGPLRIVLLAVLIASSIATTAFGRVWVGQLPRSVSTTIVISQVYGGGGNMGSLYTNDFVELLNVGPVPYTFTNYSVQYASATGTAWQVSVLTGTVTLQPGQYYLIQEARGTGGTQPLPTPDNIGSIPMSATAGRIALVNNSTALACGANCHADPSVVDYVGYGSTAVDFEGTGPALGAANAASVVRLNGGCQDTDNNGSDFTAANPPTPRNTLSPPSPCGTPGTATETSTSGPTNTPGGPTSTSTSVPSNTNTPTITATSTSTSTPGVVSGVEIYMLYTRAYSTTQSDEAVRLLNTGLTAVAVGGWRVQNELNGTITLPAGTTLAPGQKIWVANQAVSFRTYFGFNPDFEYGADSDPSVPQATATSGFAFADTGGAVQLIDAGNSNQDTIVYGTGDVSTPGWSGSAVQFYLPSGQPTFTAPGQILNRKLEENSNRPVSDTNTVNDWAQDDDPTGTATPVPGDREYDDVNGKKILRPGWALTDPAYEDMFITKKYTDTNVTTKFLVDPDNSFQPVRDLLLGATQSITIETYEWHNAQWVQDIIDAKNRGVQVHIVLDGNPCCTQLPDDETLWSAKQWELAGIPVYFFSGSPAVPDDNYRYNNVHAKIMVVDSQWVLTGSDNFTTGGMPNDPRGNGTAGNRGAMIITNAPDVVNYTLRLIAFDFQPGRYADLVRYPGLGTPPPAFSPTPGQDMTGYTPVKPTALVVTETQNIEIVQSPDNALRDVDSLIGLVNRAGAGDQVMVEQQYERKYWETSITDGPNPRLAAYIRAAQRGATVRILLDGFFESADCTSLTHNPATIAYVNGLGLPNLQAKMAVPAAGYPAPGPGTPTPTAPTTGNIHNKMVLVSSGTQGYLHVTSINGSLNSSKNNREYGLQIQSNSGYQYYKDVFDYDWTTGFLPCGQGGGTATPTLAAQSPTPNPTPQCNLLSNPGFESGSQSPWVTTTPGITATVVSTPVLSGNFAIGVTSVFTVNSGGSQGIQQDVLNIVGGATYRVAAGVLRSATNIASARIRVTWYPCPQPGTCSGTNADMFLGVNGPSWQYISQTMLAPATAMSARYKPVFYTSDGQPATIYFDDLVFDCNGNSTATPTPSVTASSTATQGIGTTVTPTAASSNTPTSTPTVTVPQPSPTITVTVPLPSATPSSTVAPSATGTVTLAPSATLTSTVLPSATRTTTAQPSNTATNTVQPSSTSTPAVTPTSCSVVFADVPVGSTFYTFVRCLACRGIISGYPCGGPGEPCDNNNTPYFRPGNNVTRGQIAKIVSNAAGFVESPGAQIFEDVPPANAFFPFINRLYNRGVMGGYPCGGTNPETGEQEPCVQPNNRPYFRPSNTATRGQLAKIVSNAAGFSDTPAGQTFEDVGTTHPFYVWIERLTSRGVMGGYPCGGVNPETGQTEPCGSQNRPYFRPYNHVTRGQTSKIVANTFFPNCLTP